MAANGYKFLVNVIYRPKQVLLLCPVLLFASLLFGAPTLAAPPAPNRAAMEVGITAACRGIGDAFTRRDVNAVMAYFTADFVNIDEGGHRLNREQTRRDYQKQLEHIVTIHSRCAIESLTPTAAGALAEMRIYSDGTGEKRVLFARLHGTFHDDLQVRDVWVNTPQGWRLQHRQTMQHDLHTRPF